MARPKVPAVVYSFANTSGFGVIRSLAVDRVPVRGLHFADCFTSLSRHFQAVTCPDPAADPERFVSFLEEEGKRLGKAVLFLSEDIAAFLVSMHAARLKKHYHYPFLSEPALAASLNKWTMHETCERLGIPTAKTARLGAGLPPADIRDFRYPLILKPVFSTFNVNEGKAQGVNAFRRRYDHAKALRAETPEAFARLADDVVAAGFDMLVQEEIPGGCQSLYETKFYVNQRGETERLAIGHKIRQMPADFGICSLGEIQEDGPVAGYTRTFLADIGYRGIGEIEFKFDARDGLYKFIEINPRPNHWLAGTTFNGRNYPLLQYYDFAEGRSYEAPAVSVKKNWMHLEGELNYLAEYGFDRKSPYHVPFGRWLGSLRERPLVEAYASWGDPWVSAYYLARCFWRFSKKALKKSLQGLFRR